jgi:hypothetical protein
MEHKKPHEQKRGYGVQRELNYQPGKFIYWCTNGEWYIPPSSAAPEQDTPLRFGEQPREPRNSQTVFMAR